MKQVDCQTSTHTCYDGYTRDIINRFIVITSMCRRCDDAFWAEEEVEEEREKEKEKETRTWQR